MHLYDLYGPVRNVFDACIYITRASGRGLGSGNQGFYGPCEMHRADRRVGGIGYFFLFPHNAIFKPTDLAVVGFLPRQIWIPLRNRGYAISQFWNRGWISLFDSYEEWHFPFLNKVYNYSTWDHIHYTAPYSIRIGQSHVLFSDQQKKISTFGVGNLSP